MKRSLTIHHHLAPGSPTTVTPIYIADGDNLKQSLEIELGRRVLFDGAIASLRVRADINSSSPPVPIRLRELNRTQFLGFMTSDAANASNLLHFWMRRDDGGLWRKVGAVPLVNSTIEDFLNVDAIAVAGVPADLGHRTALGVSLDRPLSGNDEILVYGSGSETFTPSEQRVSSSSTESNVTVGDGVASTLIAHDAAGVRFSVIILNSNNYAGDLLIRLGNDAPTVSNYSLSLGPREWVELGSREAVKAIASPGQTIAAKVTEFR